MERVKDGRWAESSTLPTLKSGRWAESSTLPTLDHFSSDAQYSVPYDFQFDGKIKNDRVLDCKNMFQTLPLFKETARNCFPGSKQHQRLHT